MGGGEVTPGLRSGLGLAFRDRPVTLGHMNHLPRCLLLLTALAPALASAEENWTSLFDGTSLKGWHVSTSTGHSKASDNKSGGKWEVVDGAITGSQDIPGNGGIIITDEQFGDFEVKLEMKNDFGPDSGLFLRSTEDGKAWQAMIDYHADGNLMGIYGEGLGGQPHVRNYSFREKVTDIDPKPTGEPPVALPVLPEAWPYFWRADQWNELRARIVGNPPHITTWINGVKIMEWKESQVRHAATGGIALQVHGGGDFTKQFVRYRNIQVKRLAAVEEVKLPQPKQGVINLEEKSTAEYQNVEAPDKNAHLRFGAPTPPATTPAPATRPAASGTNFAPILKSSGDDQ